MIRICITIPEETDAAHLKIEAEQTPRLLIETEQHEFILQLCKCGCRRRFFPRRKTQEFFSARHEQNYQNKQRRKG